MLLNVDTFFFNDTATTEIYTLSLQDALPMGTFQILFFENITRGRKKIEREERKSREKEE